MLRAYIDITATAAIYNYVTAFLCSDGTVLLDDVLPSMLTPHSRERSILSTLALCHLNYSHEQPHTMHKALAMAVHPTLHKYIMVNAGDLEDHRTVTVKQSDAALGLCTGHSTLTLTAAPAHTSHTTMALPVDTSQGCIGGAMNSCLLHCEGESVS